LNGQKKKAAITVGAAALAAAGQKVSIVDLQG
jgi:hypothetical protein